MKALLRPRQLLTLWVFAVVGTTVTQVQSQAVGIPVNQVQNLSHTSCCQQRIAHQFGICPHRSESWLCYLTSCWDTTLPEEPKVCWGMPFLASLALVTAALLLCLCPERQSWCNSRCNRFRSWLRLQWLGLQLQLMLTGAGLNKS